jgi:predicted DNA-binding transcriptional regulator YafY
LQNTIESECKVVLNLYPNKELKQQIFSFGADVEVLSPKELREEIKQEIEKCLKLYSTMQKECTSVE